MKDFLTIENTVEYKYVIKKSIFICTLSPILSLEEGMELLKLEKDKYPDASHHCYAIIGIPGKNEEKASDAGEPMGSAAQPIKVALKNNSLSGVACFVTRYFGGTKLGVSGLARAYALCVAETIKIAVKKLMSWSIIYSLPATYSEATMINTKLEEQGFMLTGIDYSTSVMMNIAVPIERSQDFLKMIDCLTLGRIKPVIIREEYTGYRR